ncbi:hypothetical protein IW138_002952 [Coemansia sp. RSA 986]|nr:hypothetical protein LPJ74_004882 [Coemansia sp. RSA 1843]KAJ2090142.1 hypothetical protein IW138_002952 [Coemansia sp. RSA 986]
MGVYAAARIELDVIDLDHGYVGSQITYFLQQRNTLKLEVVNQNRPQYSLATAKEYVRKSGRWGAFVINPGASNRLQRAILARNDTSYNSSEAMTVLLSSGRNSVVSSKYVQPELETLAQYATTQFAIAHVSSTRNVTEWSLSTLISPVGYTTVDVAPYGFGIARYAPMYAVFVSVACTLAAQILVKLSCGEMYSRVNHHHLAVYFHMLMVAWSTLLSLFCALAVLAFRERGYNAQRLGLPMTAGRVLAIFGTFDAALLVTSQWLFFWITLLPPDFVPFIFVLTLTTTSVSSTVALELVPASLRWIVAVPGYNSATLFRYIVSGAYPQLGMHIGILLGEAGAMFLLNSAAIMVRQYWLISGFADDAGWFKASIFYKCPAIAKQESVSDMEQEYSIEDDTNEPVDQIRYTLFGS